MSDFATLAYLDFLRARNYVRNLGRSPGRLVLWLIYLLWFAFMLITRILTASITPNARATGIAEPFASAIAFAFVAATGAFIWRAANGQIGAFASRADARFLTASQLDERAVASWLQIRTSASIIARFLFLIVLYTMIFHSAGSVAGMMFSMFAGAAFIGSVSIPALALARLAGARLVSSVAIAIMAAGALPAVGLALHYGYDTAFTRPLSAQIVNLHAGALLNSMLLGNLVPVIALCVLAACMVALAYFSARDLYPELYSASVTGFERASRMRAFGRGRGTAKYTISAAPVPARIRFSGAWTSISKDWIAVRRAKNFAMTMALGAVFWIGVGAGGAVLTRGNGGGGTFFGFFSALMNMIVIFSVSSAVTLAGDLRKPIWWLTPDGLRARFWAWSVASSWRSAVGFALGMGAYCAVAGIWKPLALGLPVAIALSLLIRAVALATYAMVPAPSDQRGPVALLRILITYGLFLPPAIALTLFGTLTHHWGAAAVPALLAALGEIALLVEFATWRIQGNGAAFALAEAG